MSPLNIPLLLFKELYLVACHEKNTSKTSPSSSSSSSSSIWLKKMEGYKIERKSSIEREPQTLSLDQIKYAREAALYVLRTNSIEEAIRIFTEGLQPVLGVKNGSVSMNMVMDSNEDGETLDRITVDHVLAGLRDTVTAPF